MRFSDTSLLLLALLASRNSYGYLTTGRASLRSRMFHQLSSLDESADSQNQDNTEEDDRKNYIPKRKDTCKLLISGIIGTDPKEAYLSNDHYVINFALAVVGHYESVHDWEKPKMLETMWINVEVWDEVAKSNSQKFRKGATLHGLGTLIFSKWIDKTTGEERKQFKHRLLKILSAEEMTLFDDLGSSETKILSSPVTISDKINETVPMMPQEVILPEKLSYQIPSTDKVVANDNGKKSAEKSPVIDRVDSIKPAVMPAGIQLPVRPSPVSNNSRVRYGAYDPDIE